MYRKMERYGHLIPLANVGFYYLETYPFMKVRGYGVWIFPNCEQDVLMAYKDIMELYFIKRGFGFEYDGKYGMIVFRRPRVIVEEE